MAASMSHIISSYFSGDSNNIAKQLAAEINKSNAKFLDFIENLREYLTSADTVARGRATQLIGDLILVLPPSFLTEEQVDLVVTFLLTKLADHHSVQPSALHALAALTSRYSPPPSGLVEQICRTIFREIQNQTLSHNDRRATYLILQNLLGSAWNVLEKMGGDFIVGFIQQMDAEKDPRNLIICFNCAHFICSNAHLGPFAEEMFEVLGCYFPIDFVPPPSDPHGITKEELTMALQKCLAANAELAQYCVPLLLEKITSDLQAARLDAFLTLAECAPVYGSKGLTEFLGSITSSVKREVLMNLSTALVDAAIGAIKAVYSSLVPPSNVDNSKDKTVNTELVELYQDLNKYLDGSDIKKSCLAYSLCHSVASSSPLALTTMVPLVLPSLITLCSKNLQPSELLALLKELTEFVNLILQVQSDGNVVQLLQDHLSSLFTLYENLLKQENKDIMLESVKVLTLFATSTLYFTVDRCDQFIDVLLNKLMNVSDSHQKDQLLSSLHTVVKQNPGLSVKTMESLMQVVKTANSKQITEALVRTVIDITSFIKVSEILLTIISQDLITNFSLVINCTETLSQLLAFQSGDEACMDLVVNKVALILLRTAMISTLHWNEETKDKCATFMSCLRDVFILIGCSLKKSDVILLWNKLCLLMLNSDTNSIDLLGDFKTVKPLQPEAPWQQTRLTALLEGFVIGGDIQAMIEQREAVFEAVFRLAVEAEDNYTHLSACRCIAAIFNKAPIGSEIQWTLEPLLERLKSVMIGQGSLASQIRAISVWVWMTKAMECRAHSSTGILSLHLISLLSDEHLGPLVAARIGLVVEDVENIFTAKLKGNITPLYKQRFFALNLKSILDGYHNANSKEIKQNHLTAISQITSNLPLQVIKPHFAKLVPLLLLSLDQPSTTNHSHTLSALCNAVQHATDVIALSVDSLIPRLLDLARNDSSMKVRIMALKLMENLTALPVHVIAPHQPRLVHELAIALDDKKRLVRKQAVETRGAWILLESPK